MTITKMTVAGLPESDTVYQVDDAAYFRLRVKRVPDPALPPDGGTAPIVVVPAAIAYAMQVSPCDSAGDVLRDATGNNILLPEERHSLDANILVDPNFNASIWAQARIADVLGRAARQYALFTQPNPF